MNKQWILCSVAAAAVAFTAPQFSFSAQAAETAATESHEGHGEHKKGDYNKMKREAPKSRSEAIARAKEHVTRLESMSDAEWQEKRKNHEERREMREERREKWKNATPEQREEMKNKFKEKGESKAQ